MNDVSSFAKSLQGIIASNFFTVDLYIDCNEFLQFLLLLQAMRHAGKEPFPTIYVDGKEEGTVRMI